MTPEQIAAKFDCRTVDGYLTFDMRMSPSGLRIHGKVSAHGYMFACVWDNDGHCLYGATGNGPSMFRSNLKLREPVDSETRFDPETVEERQRSVLRALEERQRSVLRALEDPAIVSVGFDASRPVLWDVAGKCIYSQGAGPFSVPTGRGLDLKLKEDAKRETFLNPVFGLPYGPAPPPLGFASFAKPKPSVRVSAGAARTALAHLVRRLETFVGNPETVKAIKTLTDFIEQTADKE